MLEVSGVTKRYGKIVALRDVNFSVESGEVVGLLGLNGAGKSSIMNIITGYIGATEGHVIIDGHNILEEPIKARRCIGYLPEQAPLFMDMTVEDYLKFSLSLKKAKVNGKKCLDQVAEQVGLNNVRKRVIRNLSKGYRQRVGVAQALIGDPRLLILDEPTAGFDPAQTTEIRSLIRNMAGNKTVLFSSHNLSEVQSVCNRVIVLYNGAVVADNSPENLANDMLDKQSILVRIKGDREKIDRVLSAMAGISKAAFIDSKEAGTCEYMLESGVDEDIREALFVKLAQNGLPLLFSHKSVLSLEDIFMNLIEKNKMGGV